MNENLAFLDILHNFLITLFSFFTFFLVFFLLWLLILAPCSSIRVLAAWVLAAWVLGVLSSLPKIFFVGPIYSLLCFGRGRGGKILSCVDPISIIELSQVPLAFALSFTGKSRLKTVKKAVFTSYNCYVSLSIFFFLQFSFHSSSNFLKNTNTFTKVNCYINRKISIYD